MRLVNKTNQNQIIRRSSFSSLDVNKFGRENNVITLTTGAYAQKVYNKVVQAPNVLSPIGVNPTVAAPIEKKVPVFYKDNNISVTQENITIDKDGNVVSETSSPSSATVYGQGNAKILIDPFDNFYKFTVYVLRDGTTLEILDLGTSLTYYMVFIDNSGQEVRIENIKNKTNISNPSAGQVAFKLVDTNSKKVLGFSSRGFYIISRTPDGIETKLYSGTWQNQSEFSASVTSSGNAGTSGTSGTAGTAGTGGVASSSTTVTSASTTGTATTTTGSPVTSKVPLTRIIKPIKPYVLGSSAILSVKPTSEVNTTGGYVSSKNAVNVNASNTRSSTQSNNIDIASLADSISGKEAQGLNVQKVVNYYFTPGAPGAVLFKGIKPSEFLTAALQIHPKLENGSFDPTYIQ
jgi:hypothetical protein